MIARKQTKQIKIGGVAIGGNAPISIQSMTCTRTKDVAATVAQILELEKIGCEIVRVAVTDLDDAQAIADIKKQINIPLVADIHFDYRLALESIKYGVDKLRINPGNIGSNEKIKMVVKAAKDKNIPIRIGVNSGSLEKDILEKHGGHVTAQGLVESALRHIKILEDLDFRNIAVAVKASDVRMNVEAYRLLSQQVDYPLHLGVTEAGTKIKGTIKSAAALGSLLIDGIGDTIRISLTDNPVEEIMVAKELLNSLGLRRFGINFVSCPTCARTKIDLINLAKKVETALQNIDKPLTVAIMGCAVNGPGEAREADIGIAGGDGEGLLFKKGKIIKKVAEADLLDILIKEVNEWK